jgi:superfamily II DNA or RNA helicase
MPELPPHREPQFIDEAEALIGPFFTNDDHERLLQYEGIKHLDPEMVLERHGAYIGALRILATDRHCERKKADSPGSKWNEAYERSLTFDKMQTIAGQHTEKVNELGDVLAHANNARPIVNQEDFYAELFEHQKPYMREVVKFLHSPVVNVVSPISTEADPPKYRVKGAVVSAATGLGKSALMGRTAMAAGIGSPLKDGSRNHRLLVVTPSRLLNEQLAGIVGDDTFRRFAPPGIKVVAYAGGEKRPPDPTADAVVTTIEQFVANTSNGLFYGQEFDLLLIDEAHQLTEPQFTNTFLTEWRVGRNIYSEPIPTIGFTARTAYDEIKDAAKLLPVVIKHESLIDYMRKGVLSSGQFFTVVAEPEYATSDETPAATELKAGAEAAQLRNEALLKAAHDIIIPLVKEGRRGIVFCEAGGKSRQARNLAKSLQGEVLDDGSNVSAEALYVWSPKTLKQSKQKIEAYNRGEIDVLATVGVGQQGLNADFNFVIICGNITSRQKFIQEIGRGMRRSKKFPVTLFFHIVAGYADKTASTVTFGDVLEEELGQAGMIMPEPVSRRKSAIRENYEKGFNIEAFPQRIRVQLERVKTHNSQEIECLVNGQQPIPDDYVSFEEELYPRVPNHIDPASAKRRLDAAGYSWRGRVEQRGGKNWLHRFYEPAASSFFTEKPIPAHAESDMMTSMATAKHLDIGEAYLETLRKRMEEETEHRRVLRLNRRNSASLHYTSDAIAWLEEEVAKLPWQEAGEATQAGIAEELDVNPVVVIRLLKKIEAEPTYKRKLGGKGFAWFHSKETVEAVKAAYHGIAWASDDEWSFARIGEEAGIATKHVYTNLTPEESEAITVRRTYMRNGTQRELDHIKESIAKRIVARIKDKQAGMPAHIIPYATVIEQTHAPKKTIPKIVEDAELRQYGGNNFVTRFVGWEGLRRIIEKYGWRDTIHDIDFDRLPKSPDDTDEARLLYARSVQLRFMTATFMGNPDGIIDD